MKQLFIADGTTYPSSATPNDVETLASGTIVMFSLADNSLLTAKPTSNFSIAVSRGGGKMPLIFPEVDVKTLQVSKATFEEGATFTAKITVPTPEKDKHYTIVVIKKGTVFNERSNWTFTTLAKSTTAADVAKELSKQINANRSNLGLAASYSGGAITVTAVEKGKDYEVKGADSLMGVEPTAVTTGKKAVCDKEYIQDLASRCAAGKGFNYLAEDGKEIYPGYPEEVKNDKYVLYTLRFAVPRVSAKQRDEVVYQLVHIAVPTTATAVVTKLDTIFGLTAPSAGA